jgi:hypothetical protein
MKPQTQGAAQPLTWPNNGSGQVQPVQVWDQLSPTQQQIIFQNLVLICRQLLAQINPPPQLEVQDESQ